MCASNNQVVEWVEEKGLEKNRKFGMVEKKKSWKLKIVDWEGKMLGILGRKIGIGRLEKRLEEHGWLVVVDGLNGLKEL